MADVTIDDAELARIKRQSDHYKGLAKKFKSERNELAEGFNALEEDFTAHRTASSKDALSTKNAELSAKLRGIDAKAKFKELAGDLKPEAVEAAWKLAGYKSESDEPDEEALQASIEKIRGESSFLFNDAKAATTTTTAGKPAAKPPAAPGPGFQRTGGRDTGKVGQFTLEQMQNPDAMTRNPEAFAKAAAEAVAAR